MGSLPGGALVAVIADTHLPRGTRRLPQTCQQLLEEADLILHAGDFVSERVLDELAALAPVEGVAGNMDEDAIRSRLPGRSVAEIDGVRIGIVHDAGPRTGREERLVSAFPGCAAIVYGHTHVPQLERYRGVWIVNPGSPTERRTAPGHSMATLRISAGALEPALIRL